MSKKKEPQRMKHEIHEKKSKGLVPGLRFPEFQDAGGWEERELGKEATIVMGASPKSEFYNEENIGLPLLQGNTDIKNRVSAPRIFTSQITKECHKGNILLSVRAPVGTVAKSLHHACIGRGIAAIRANKDNSQEFLYQWLFAFEPQWQNISQGGTFEAVNSDDIRQLTIAFPKIPEQQKIADCLSSLDELITAEVQKIDTLKAHKKGLMQKLFPAEGETVPRLRFPEFRDAGEWGTRELGEFITERNQFPKESVSLFSLTIEDGITPKTKRYERSFLVNDEVNAYKLVLPDDFAYNPMNLRFGAIGRHSGTENVAVSKYYNIFFCDKTVDSKFCKIYFKSDIMIAFYDNMAIGSLIEKRRVHFSEFLKFNIRFPLLPEQQKIADCLSSLDELITAEAQKLDTLKAHKKGLMQGLFPSADEVGV